MSNTMRKLMNLFESDLTDNDVNYLTAYFGNERYHTFNEKVVDLETMNIAGYVVDYYEVDLDDIYILELWYTDSTRLTDQECEEFHIGHTQEVLDYINKFPYKFLDF